MLRQRLMLRWTSLFTNRLPKGVRRKQRMASVLTRRLAVETLEDRRMLTVDLVGVADWIELGSSPMTSAGSVSAPGNPASGGVEEIAVDPNNPARIFLGTINGGIWRTTNGDVPFNGIDDGGLPIADDAFEQPDWEPLTDEYPSLAIGDIAFDPLDPAGNTIFAGSGSASSLANVGGTAIGVFRSTDGGDTWEVFPVNPGNEPQLRVVLPTVFDGDNVTPGVQQVVLVGAVPNFNGSAANTGLYRSIDGGETYTLISGTNGLSNGPVTQIIADPNNSSQYFAGVVGQGVFRSGDGGLNWTAVNTNLTNLPTSTAIQVAAHPGGGTTVLHTLISGATGSGTTLMTVTSVAFTSNNGGNTWTQLAPIPGPGGFDGSRPDLYTSLAADQLVIDPANPQIVYIAKGYGGSPILYRYNPGGGGSWTLIDSGGAAGGTRPHVDSRDLKFIGNNILLHANDGGIYFMRNPQAAAANSWTSFHGIGATGLGATEYHNAAWDSTFNVAFAGAQDNGTSVQNGAGDVVWTQFQGSDGGDVVVDTVNAGAGLTFRYASTQNLGVLNRYVFDSATNIASGPVDLFPAGGLANFNPPFVPHYELNTADLTRLVMGAGGTSPVYELLDASTAPNSVAATWQAVPIGAGFGGVNRGTLVYGGRMGGVDNAEVLMAGSGGGVYLRSTAGGTLTATPVPFPGGNVQDIVVDPENWQHFFVADGAGVWETTDAGSTPWNNLSLNLGVVNTRLNSLEFIPTSGLGALVVGGNLGSSKLVLDNLTAQWTRFGTGLPNAVVDELDYDADDDILLAGTFGRGAHIIEDASIVVEDEGILNICGDEDHTNQDDLITLVRNALNPLILDVFINSITPVFSVALALVEQINVFGVGGNDTLIVDSSNGLINVPDGIRYNGDGQCPHEEPGAGFDRGIDTLNLTQTNGVTHLSDTLTVGATVGQGISTIVGVGVGNVQTIFFEELEPIVDNVPAINLFVNGATVGSLLNGANQITYDNSDLFDNTWARITVDRFEPFHFTAKQTVTIDAENGDDTIVINNGALPTDLIQLIIDADNGNDVVNILAIPDASATSFVSVVVLGGAGNDVIDGSLITVDTPLLLNGEAGNDTLLGGAGDDELDGGNHNDRFVASAGNDSLQGGTGIDQIDILGQSGIDVIAINQTAATILEVNYNGDARTYLVSNIEQVFVNGGLGDDIVAINVDDAIVASSTLPFEVVGDSPNASDRLIVNDDGLGDLVVHHEGPDGRSGAVTVGLFAPIDYSEIERVDITPLNGATGGTGTDGLGRLIVFDYDDFESNDSLANASPVGVTPVFVAQRNINPGSIALPPPFPGVPGDADWYEFRPGKIGTFRFEVLFEEINTLANGRAGLPGGGDLAIQVYRADGMLIVASDSANDNESLDISMDENNSYYLRVYGSTPNVINIYDLNVVEVDVLGPQVTSVVVTDDPVYDLFDPKPSVDGPTPLIHSITLNLRDLLDFDLLNRAPGDLYDALDAVAAASFEHYEVRGDHVGLVAIQEVIVTNDPPVVGQIATATVELVFADPLPDDRFTLTVFDSLIDPPGNALDGGANTNEPQENPTFPSGDGVAGGDFVARFTVDSRAEIGVWAAGSVLVDTNGNFFFDPTNTDATNRDLTYRIGFDSDYIFAGKFSVRQVATGFDTIAAYGRVNGNQYRWLIDTDDNGVVDLISFEPVGAGINGYPVAGNFDGNPLNGDEVGLFDGQFWYLDTDHDFNVSDETPIAAIDYSGFPIVGDFDGDGDDDVATYIASSTGGNLFSVDLNQALAGNPILIDGVADFSFQVGFPNTGGFGFAGVRERPVAADFNADGIDDFGLWVPDGIVPVPNELSEWYLLLSGDDPFTFKVETSVLDRIQGGPLNGFVPFSPEPFGNDLYAQFGNTFSLPIVGNFDPPVSPGPSTFVSRVPKEPVVEQQPVEEKTLVAVVQVSTEESVETEQTLATETEPVQSSLHEAVTASVEAAVATSETPEKVVAKQASAEPEPIVVAASEAVVVKVTTEATAEEIPVALVDPPVPTRLRSRVRSLSFGGSRTVVIASTQSVPPPVVRPAEPQLPVAVEIVVDTPTSKEVFQAPVVGIATDLSTSKLPASGTTKSIPNKTATLVTLVLAPDPTEVVAEDAGNPELPAHSAPSFPVSEQSTGDETDSLPQVTATDLNVLPSTLRRRTRTLIYVQAQSNDQTSPQTPTLAAENTADTEQLAYLGDLTNNGGDPTQEKTALTDAAFDNASLLEFNRVDAEVVDELSRFNQDSTE